LKALGENPDKSVPEATASVAEAQGIYRLWSNAEVSAEGIMGGHRERVVHRGKESGVVLAIQDTTDLDYTTHPKTTGLGFINKSRDQGLKVHTCLGVSGAGEPLGVLNQSCWTRPERFGKSRNCKTIPIQDKESYRWLKTVSAAEKGFSKETQVVHVGDREADIFELFAHPRAVNSHLLIRAEYNRRVQHELGYLLPTLNQSPCFGEIEIEIDRTPKRPARKALLRARGLQVTIEVPVNHPKPHNLQPVILNALLVEELQPPEDGGEPIRWLLLTSLPIDSFEQVWQIVRWYSYRWLIERFHFTLKSGCRIESLQLESKEKLVKALATFNIIAWRLMSLTYKARIMPDKPCDSILQPAEWKLLRRKFQPMSRSTKVPTIREAVFWIARLGGFLNRKGDGDPGIKNIWRGLGKLCCLLQGTQLAPKS
jgi:Transposase Tn5 dimerisation domain